MELPLEQIADAVGTLRMLHDRTERERRHLPRFPVWAPATVQLLEHGGAREALDVHLTNLACGGIGFLSPRPLGRGQKLHVSLATTEAGLLNALCEVVHCSRGAGEALVVGARFAATYSREPAAAPEP